MREIRIKQNCYGRELANDKQEYLNGQNLQT